jgi:predicted dehydrogenase
MKYKSITRRQFCRRALGIAGSSALFSIVPRNVLGGPGYTAPSEILTHAVIGIGGMGMNHLADIARDDQAKLVAVCDVDEQHLETGLVQGGKDVQGYKDFRELLQRRDIDIVHIVTPPHWHALIAIAAADAGFDIVCEKPMTRTIGEGQYIVDAVRRNGRIFRLNTWFRFQSGGFYGSNVSIKALRKMVLGGLLGEPLTVRISPSTGFAWKVKEWSGQPLLKPETPPSYLNYNMWLGPAPVKPYSPDRVHRKFRGYWDYDGGGLGDMGMHYLDPIQYVLGKDDTSPVEIEAYAPWPTHPDAIGLWGRVTMTYADGTRLILESEEWGEPTERGKPLIEGPKGKVYKDMVTEPANLKDAVASLPDPEPMIDDFRVAVRTRRKFALNEMNGNRSNMLVHLANAAIRTGRKLRFDPVSQHFVGDEEANRLVDQPMRAPWRL